MNHPKIRRARFTACCFVLLCAALAFAERVTDSQTITTSGGSTNKISNIAGGLTGAFEEVIAGSPATVSIVIQGCASAGTCDTLETNTSTAANQNRTPAINKAYSYFIITASWTGGTKVSVTINTVVSTAKNPSTGGAVASVNGQTGAVSLAASDVGAISNSAGAVNNAALATGAVTDDKASLAVKPAVTVVASANSALSGLLTIDGVTTIDGSIVLATAQSTGSQNGPWVVHSGAWTRPTWYPSGGTTQAFQFITAFVRLGAVNGGSTWRITSSGAVTIDTTSTTWVITPYGSWAQQLATLNGLVFANAGMTVQQAMTAAGVNGVAQIPAIYAGVDIPAGTRLGKVAGTPSVLYNPTSSTQPAGVQIQDYRFGSNFRSIFNPQLDSLSAIDVGFGTLCQHTTVPNSVSDMYCDLVQQNVYDGGSNINSNGYVAKLNYQARSTFLNNWSAGQTVANLSFANNYGPGDVQAFSGGCATWGGVNAGSDEGCEPISVSGTQGYVATVATVASGGSTASQSLTLSVSQGEGYQAAGRYLINTALSSNTGLVTTVASSGPTVYTFSGVTLPTSTETTLSTSITTPGVHTVTVASIGTISTSTYVCVADGGNIEGVYPSAVVGSTFTANFRKPHTVSAIVAYGGWACDGIELTADRYTTTGPIAFWNVVNTIRRVFPIISTPTASTAKVWISGAGIYSGYIGNATISAGSNAYVHYPMAEVTSVLSGGTWSDTFTLAPNAVAWANGNAVEEPDYHAIKMSMGNNHLVTFWPCLANSPCDGYVLNLDGVWGGNVTGLGVANNTAASLYSVDGLGGQLSPPLNALATSGVFRFGINFLTAPSDALIQAACPPNGCANGRFTTILQILSSAGGDLFKYDSGNQFWDMSTGNQTFHFTFGQSGDFTAKNGALIAATTITAGTNGGTGGVLTLNGATSGGATIAAPAVAGTSTNPFTLSNVLALPTTATCANPSLTFTGFASFGLFYDPTGGRTGLGFCVSGGANLAIYNNGLETQGGMSYCWAPSTNVDSNCDTNLSRGAAGLVDIGTGSGGSTAGFIKSAQSIAITGADVTCGTGGTISSCVAMQTITGLTVALPHVAATWNFTCDLTVGQATAAAANQIGVQTATNGATNLSARAIAYTAATSATAASITGVTSTTTAQSVITFTPGATGTKMPIHLSGTIEGASASGTTLNVTVLTGAAADLLTIYRDSSCYVY